MKESIDEVRSDFLFDPFELNCIWTGRRRRATTMAYVRVAFRSQYILTLMCDTNQTISATATAVSSQ